MTKFDTFILVTISLFIVFVILPSIYDEFYNCKYNETFTTLQNPDLGVPSEMPNDTNKKTATQVYDNIMITNDLPLADTNTASQWIAPAWNPEALEPGTNKPVISSICDGSDIIDYENDPRMIYNKCSLSCCSSQYPTPFQGSANSSSCNTNKINNYMTSNYTCQSSTAESGCLCMTQTQVNTL